MDRPIEDLARTFIDLAWNKGHFNLLRQYCTTDFHYHTTFNEQVLDFDAYIAYVKTFRTCMPDIELTIESVMNKGDHAMAYNILSGTIIKPFFGLPASDKLITFTAISTLNFNKGKIESLDSLIDMAGIQRQVETPIVMDLPLNIDS